jgi:hypothetical protein
MDKALLLIGLLSLSVNSTELQNISLTPGVARSVTLTELCTTSTSLVRNVPETLKKQVYTLYKMKGNDRTQCSEGYEIDHLISLELGGANDVKNLWPQSYCGKNNAHDKDKLENELHRRICTGKIKINDAQQCIASDWVMCSIKTFK